MDSYLHYGKRQTVLNENHHKAHVLFKYPIDNPRFGRSLLPTRLVFFRKTCTSTKSNLYNHCDWPDIHREPGRVSSVEVTSPNIINIQEKQLVNSWSEV